MTIPAQLLAIMGAAVPGDSLGCRRLGDCTVADTAAPIFAKLAGAPALVGTAHKGDRQYHVCPHCDQELKPADVYTAKQGLTYCRRCFRSGKGGAIRFGETKVPVQAVKQKKDFTCGPAALKALGIKGTEAEIAEEVEATPAEGTKPAKIIAAAKRQGFTVEAGTSSIQKLKGHIDAGHGVVCPIQFSEGKPIKTGDANGHYVTVCSYGAGEINFVDPAQGKIIGLPEEEFLNVWHDRDAAGKVYKNYGIAMWREDLDSKPEQLGGIPKDRWKEMEKKLAGDGSVMKALTAEMEKDALTKAELKAHAATVDTAPTEAQKETGNYRHAHISWRGLPIAIENPMNSYRRGVSKDGKPWESKMTGAHYGYLKRTRSDADQDAIDIFLAGDAAANLDSDIIFCINQNKPGTNDFDEHKFVGARSSAKEAKETYLANYDKNWTGFRSVVALTLDQFKWWLKNGDSSKPIEAEDFLPVLEKVASTFSRYRCPHCGGDQAYTGIPGTNTKFRGSAHCLDCNKGFAAVGRKDLFLEKDVDPFDKRFEKKASVITVTGNQISLDACFEPLGDEFNKEALDNVGDVKAVAGHYLRQLLTPWLTQHGLVAGSLTGENQVDLDRQRALTAGQMEAARVADDSAAENAPSSSLAAQGNMFNENVPVNELGSMLQNGASPTTPASGSAKLAAAGPEELVQALEKLIKL